MKKYLILIMVTNALFLWEEALSQCLDDSITIVINTDFYPEQTAWTIIDVSNNTVIDSISFGDLTALNSTYTWDICVPSGCYLVAIEDDFGDGLTSFLGNGSYEIYYNNSLIATGSEFGYGEVVGSFGNCTSNCPEATITVNVLSDGNGNETTWELYDQNTLALVASGGPFADNTFNSMDICIDTSECYEFVIKDASGEGICCGDGFGYFSVSFNGQPMGRGGQYLDIKYVVNMGNNCPTSSLIVDTTTYSYEDLVEVFLGPCTKAMNITYSGAGNAIGYFSGGSSIGMDQGIILTSGDATDAMGPNRSGRTTQPNFTPGDADLDTAIGLIAPNNSEDAAVLEFDFIPYNDTIHFNYVFASEEYPEFVCSEYNDAFVFLVSGPGYSPNTNIALVPGTTTPVAINSVNNGSVGVIPGNNVGFCTSLANAAYYVDNTIGNEIGYDGYTIPLTATILVTPLDTYHIKIVVADVSDPAFDSGIFLEAGSFNAGNNAQSIQINTGWNIISSYAIPQDDSMPVIFEDIASDILIVKDALGQAYIPSFGIDNIGNWIITEGYKVKASATTTLKIGCEQVDPITTPIALSPGWDIIAYLRTSAMDVDTALNSVVSNILLVKNYAGASYIPAFSINSIGSMEPGQGYKIKMSAADTLVYPPN